MVHVNSKGINKCILSFFSYDMKSPVECAISWNYIFPTKLPILVESPSQQKQQILGKVATKKVGTYSNTGQMLHQLPDRSLGHTL